MTDAPVEIEKKLIDWKRVDIGFKDVIDLRALFDAIEPPADVLAERSPKDIEEDEDTLISRFRAWGWGTNMNAYATPQPLRHIGPYYDHTTIEDDERFMAAIAPFVEPDSSAFFEYHDFDVDNLGVHGWYFDGTSVRRRRAAERREYDWVDG